MDYMNENEMGREKPEREDANQGSIETSEREAIELSPAQFRAIIPPRNEDEASAEHMQSELTKELKEKLALEYSSQFEATHVFSYGNINLEYAMIDPGIGNAERSDQEWTIFIGGFSSVKETYRQEMLDLALSGKRVIFVSPDKGVPPTIEDRDYFDASGALLPDTIRNKASMISLLIDHLGITEANIIGHSQGGAIATALAGSRHDMIKRLILDNPAGIIGEDSTRGLLHRVAQEAKVEKNSLHENPTSLRQMVHMLKIPPWRAGKEVSDIARTDIRPILANIRKLASDKTAGPEVILINSNNDQIFKKTDVEKGLGENPLDRYLGRWVLYADEHAHHGKIGRNDGELLVQVMDNAPTRTSIIHQIITEKHFPTKNTENPSQ